MYPVHKLDVFNPDSDNADDSRDAPDFQINQHCFNMVLPDKPKKKDGFMNISKPHEVSKHIMPICQDEYVIREAKLTLTKLGRFEDMNDPILDKINGLFK